MGLTPLGRFSSKRRFENQKPTKTKKQGFYFSLLFDLFLHNAGQLSNLFLQDLERFYPAFKKGLYSALLRITIIFVFKN